MTFATEESEGLFTLHSGAEEQAQHAAHFFIQFLRAVFPRFDGLLVGLSHVVTIVGISASHCQTVSPGAELQVKTVLHSLIGIVATAPVGDDHTIESPVLLQYLIK